MTTILQMKRSIIAFVVALALGLLSMGALGGVLYYAVYPLFAPFHGDLNDWRGDWVWPAVIAAGMLWSFSFLVAGFFNVKLEKAGWSVFARRAIYGVVLWLGAACAWAIVLFIDIK